MDVDLLLSRVTSRQLSEWQAYSQIEPFGFEMFNLLFAQLCCGVIAPYSKKTPKIADWLLQFGDEGTTPQSAAEMRRVLKEITERDRD